MKLPMLTLEIARDFSPVPAGRYRSDGAHSGEVFREEHLRPALTKAEIVKVVLDGAEGYGSSFLEEAFGGLVRSGEIDSNDALRRIELVSDEDPTLVSEIQSYLQQEGARRAAKGIR